VWEASARCIVIADKAKVVPVLGAFALPIEVVAFGHKTTANRIADVLADHDIAMPARVRTAERGLVRTDGGNLIYDAKCAAIHDPVRLADDLKLITGVVEHGLFLDLAQPFLEGDGAREILDADAEQREGGDLQQLGQSPDRIQLDDLALLVAVKRGAGDAEPGGDLLRPETTLESVSAQLLTDIGKPHATPRPYSVLASTSVRETSSHPLRRLTYLRDLRAACNSENETIFGVDRLRCTILG
jgi:hypothetical protein